MRSISFKNHAIKSIVFSRKLVGKVQRSPPMVASACAKNASTNTKQWPTTVNVETRHYYVEATQIVSWRRDMGVPRQSLNVAFKDLASSF